MSKCKNCDADIVWLKTKTGKNMPVNSELMKVAPADDGQIVGITTDGRIIKGHQVGDVYEGDTESVYVPHFITCIERRQ